MKFFKTCPRLILITALLNVCACHQQQAESTLPQRPVKVFRVQTETVTTLPGFAAEIRPRHEAPLSFRVAGKIMQRLVENGDSVKKGQVLAVLDDSDYKLALSALQAQHQSAVAERDFAKTDLLRYQQLLEQQVISQPELDRHQTSFTTAEQRANALAAQLHQAANQLAYTRLAADHDGVVTAVVAERDQVVTAGQTLLKLAAADEMEAVFDVPEQLVEQLHVKQSIAIAVSAHDDSSIHGEIREIAAQADPATRTFQVRASLPKHNTWLRLGMTATARLDGAVNAISIPLAAVFSSQSEPDIAKVWLIDESSHQVTAVAVGLGQIQAGERVLVSGLKNGQLLVSAGAQRLLPGQSVKILTEPELKLHKDSNS